MAATRKQVEEIFAAIDKKLPGRGYYLEFENSRARVMQRVVTEGNAQSLCPQLTMTPLHQWLTVLLRGIELAQTPMSTAHQCPICGGKLVVYEALPVERWTYLCTHCEETGPITELQQTAQSNGE